MGRMGAYLELVLIVAVGWAVCSAIFCGVIWPAIVGPSEPWE